MAVDEPGLKWFWTPVPILYGAGLAPNATVTVRLRTKQPAPQAYVLLFTEAQWQACAPAVFSYAKIRPTTYWPCEWRVDFAGPIESTHVIRQPEIGLYYLGIVQTAPGVVQGLAGSIGFENPGGQQLAVQSQFLPQLVAFLAVVYNCSAFGLLGVLLWRCRGRSRLHAFLLAPILLKCVVLQLKHEDIEVVSRVGVFPVSRQVLSQLARQIEKISEVLVFFVVGLGWKVTRPQLRMSEWTFATTIATLSFSLGSFEVACNTITFCNGQNYLATQWGLHSLCFLVVIVATNFNIFTLQKQISEALATPETGVLYSKHRSYCWFRVLFLYYVIIPSALNFLTKHVVSWDQIWVVDLVGELSLWLVFTGIFLLFRPGMPRIAVFDLSVVESSDSDSTDQE